MTVPRTRQTRWLDPIDHVMVEVTPQGLISPGLGCHFVVRNGCAKVRHVV